MARAALERMLSANRRDELFRTQASAQYERELLFSQLVEVRARVVTRVTRVTRVDRVDRVDRATRVDRSVRKATQALKEVLTVTDDAVSPKRQGVEPQVCQALVRDRFREASQVIAKLKVEAKPWLRNIHTKVWDGNRLAATEHRLTELRTSGDAPLPGRTLVVWDQPTRWVCDVFLSDADMLKNERCWTKFGRPFHSTTCGSRIATSALCPFWRGDFCLDCGVARRGS